MAPWMRRPSSSSRRVAPAAAYTYVKTPGKTPTRSESGRQRSRSASSSRNYSTEDKGYNGQTITYRVFNGRGLVPGTSGENTKAHQTYVDKSANTPDDAKSRYSRRSNTTVEGTVDSIPTRDESSSSDVEGKKNSQAKPVSSATQPTKSNASSEGEHRTLYSQKNRDGGGTSRPRSAGPSYSRPTISATYQRPWQRRGLDKENRSRPSSASAVRSTPETNPILKAAEHVRTQSAEKVRTYSAEHSRPQPPTTRPQSAERSRPQPPTTRPQSAEHSRPQPPTTRPQSAERSRPQPPTTRPQSADFSRPTETKPVSSNNGVKCYPLAVHLQTKTPVSAALVDEKTKQETSKEKPSKDIEKISEREHLEKMLCSTRPKDRSSTDFYSFGEVVGSGSFAKVRLAVHKLTGQKVAIKTYEKSKIKDAHALKRINQEIKLMERLDHPLISRFFEAIESARRIHIVMELIGEGNLCSYIKEKKSLTEDQARGIFSQLCSAVEYLHAQHIIHRDIKLENVLFDSQRNIKLIDFGFSVQCKEPKTLKVFCGTPSYMAPEIVKRAEYLGKPVDMWSLGVVLFAMLSGCFPFSAKTYPDLYKKILKGTFKYPDSFSPVVRHLLTNLLCSDAHRRMKVQGARSHPWLKSYVEVKLKYTPTATFTVSQDAREDLYREAVTRMSALGVEESALCGDVIAKRRNSLTTCYYLLASAMSLRSKPGGL